MTVYTATAPGQPFILSGTEPGFDRLHGIPVAALGEESERLLALGHLTDRAVLAVTSAYHRRVLGELIVPTRELTDLIHFGTQRIHVKAVAADQDIDNPWYIEDAAPSDPTAQPVTITVIEWLQREDLAPPSPCPCCARVSRSTRFTPDPERAGWGHHHRCRHCAHQWLPTASAPRAESQTTLPRPFTPTHDLETSSCTRSA
ncbi:hypothetical protein [Streptomyces sp. NPDC056387]|uniref:hypothetical protein n=1 Tax=Streptomyces sp. NPDC056387 TaxID=3345803 RepID=UPI0035D692C4